MKWNDISGGLKILAAYIIGLILVSLLSSCFFPGVSVSKTQNAKWDQYPFVSVEKCGRIYFKADELYIYQPESILNTFSVGDTIFYEFNNGKIFTVTEW